MFSLAGPEASDILTNLGAPTPASDQIQMSSCQGSPVVIAGGSELAVPGYLIIVDETAAAELYRSLVLKASCCLLPVCSSQARWRSLNWVEVISCSAILCLVSMP